MTFPEHVRYAQEILSSITDDNAEADQPNIRVAGNRRLGAIYVLVLLLVIAMTNISVRGLWSVFVILLVLMLTIIFALSGDRRAITAAA